MRLLFSTSLSHSPVGGSLALMAVMAVTIFGSSAPSSTRLGTFFFFGGDFFGIFLDFSQGLSRDLNGIQRPWRNGLGIFGGGLGILKGFFPVFEVFVDPRWIFD